MKIEFPIKIIQVIYPNTKNLSIVTEMNCKEHTYILISEIIRCIMVDSYKKK
jgi:hypothetical protein